jgi:hypothetical protein
VAEIPVVEAGSRLTVSIGVAEFPGDACDRAELIRAADAALYAAKRLGRDRVFAERASRRRHPRRAAGGRLLFRPALQASPAPRTGTLLNVSPGGLAFAAEESPEIGEVLTFELLEGEPLFRDPLTGADSRIALGRVIWRAQRPGAGSGVSEVGVRFVGLEGGGAGA